MVAGAGALCSCSLFVVAMAAGLSERYSRGERAALQLGFEGTLTPGVVRSMGAIIMVPRSTASCLHQGGQQAQTLMKFIQAYVLCSWPGTWLGILALLAT